MEKEALARRFGDLVRRLRSERGYSQERFAEVCRIDRFYMGMIERGEVNVTLPMIAKLAGASTSPCPARLLEHPWSPLSTAGGPL